MVALYFLFLKDLLFIKLAKKNIYIKEVMKDEDISNNSTTFNYYWWCFTI